MINVQKLLLHHNVEVRQLEEGLQGSWHSGVVIGVSESCRAVRYDELLCESGSSNLVESIPVTLAIEGLHQRPSVKSNYRGRIRPIPPPTELCSTNIGLKFGVCVDVLYEDAWWEGVIFDCDENAIEHLVYFPDEGDERMYKSSDIRVTLEWDEFSGSWRERGIWQLVNLAREHQKDGNLCQLIRRAWSLLKFHYGYQKKITEWNCGAYSVWKEFFREVICDVTAKPTVKSLVFPTGSRRQVTKKRGRKPKKGKYLNVSVLTKSNREKKDKEVNLTVRTRHMCMSDPKNSPISDAAEGCHLPNFWCGHSHSTAEDSCVITDSPRADSKGGFDQFASVCCVHLSDCDTEQGKCCHVGTTDNGNLPTKSPCYYSNYPKPVRNRSRRKWHLMENSSAPKKLTPSKRISHRRRTSNGSKMVRKVDNNVAIQVFDWDKRGGLMKTQQKVGFTVRYSVLRQGGRITARRSIRKKRSPSRIKTISLNTSEEDDNKSKPLLSEISEESKSSHKEDNLVGRQCEIALPAGDSCHELVSKDALDISNKRKARRRGCLDSVCYICQYGDKLLHCDHCMSSCHISCVDPEEATVGQLFCPSCRCGLCGSKDNASKDQLFSDVCYQCSRHYHVACLDRVGISVSEDKRFCSKNCFELCGRLHQLLRISNPTSVEGLTWSVTRSRRNDCNVYNERVHPLIQVSKVLNVFHECFQPIREPHTGRDLVADIVYNSGSKFRRLDFHGFYVMALVKADEVVCAATIRIHGQKVAEMPLIATPFKYRRQGMCRLLLHELEKMLAELGVEILVLPGIATLRETWVSSFGFTEMPASARREFLGYPFVLFQGTTLFQKILSGSLEAPSNAGSYTPRSITPTSSFNKCDVHQIDTIERVVTPITLTYSRKIRLNKELPELKSMVEYEDSSHETVKLDRVQPECSENNCSKNEPRRFSLCYKRRRKLEAFNEEKTVIDGSNKKQPTLKYVYKRRRIQASISSSDYL